VIPLLLIAEALLVTALVISTRAAHRARFLLKPAASAVFVWIGWIELSRVGGSYATLILLGLVLGMIGDMLLMDERNVSFIGGLVSFLAGHLVYTAAFGTGGIGPYLPVGIAAAVILGIGSFRWLRPHLQAPFDLAVPVYILVISAMVAVAIAQAGVRPVAALGAVLFAFSDLAVARDRFVAPGRINPTIGLPLYYCAQVLLATSP
jgi:uncharacterized membrane protein YhhN